MKNMGTKQTGYILYEGKSLLNGKNIVAIAPGFKRKSHNPKTGDMIQVWILSTNNYPLKAHDLGEDKATCGDCKHRHWNTCYLNKMQAILNVYKSFKRGNYSILSDYSIFTNKSVRIGAYGDPTAVPTYIWENVLQYATGHTAYSHQWAKKKNKRYMNYCMASCDTINEAKKAIKMGYKPFLLLATTPNIPEGIFNCPASKENGSKMNCKSCKCCSGNSSTVHAYPCIAIHGARWKIMRYKTMIKRVMNKKSYAFNPIIKNGKVSNIPE
jgi:hypothetical protein